MSTVTEKLDQLQRRRNRELDFAAVSLRWAVWQDVKRAQRQLGLPTEWTTYCPDMTKPLGEMLIEAAESAAALARAIRSGEGDKSEVLL